MISMSYTHMFSLIFIQSQLIQFAPLNNFIQTILSILNRYIFCLARIQ